MNQYKREGWDLVALLSIVALGFAPMARAQEEDYPHGDMERDCSECHTTEGWRPLRDPVEFDHAETGLPLRLSHEGVACTSCHDSLEFNRVPTACVDCHFDAHRGELGFGCDDCHIPATWDNRREMWDFHSGTLFPLTGSHASVDCAGCHRGSPPFEYATTPVECFACHAADYRQTELPDHERAGFPAECELCHSTISWQPARLEGDFDLEHTFFPLTGSHRSLDCTDCHSDGFQGTPTDCFSCHRSDFESTKDPDHVQAGFPTDCENCHSTQGWEGAVSDHNQFFRLTGAHRTLDCNSCHSKGFAGTPTDCNSCHSSDYDATTDPNHAQAGFARDCESCHTTSNWGGADVDHNQFFRLTGAHRGLDCQACHSDGFAGTPTDCNSCHRSEYDSTTDPNHAQAGFPRECENCHTTSSWGGAEVNHDQFFRLTGAHRNLDCQACHSDGFAGTPTDCYSCHRSEYDSTTDPNHVQAGFPRECENCHTTSSWGGAEVDHDQFFRLTGAHRNLDCQACHSDGFAGTPTDCYSCHRSEYEGTTDPNHVQAGFPRDCENCHTTSKWGGADFDHNQYFALTGAHRNIDCQACHSDGFAGTPTDCWSCHRDDYNRTNDPDHQAAGFPQDCEVCHDTRSWEGADFSQHDSLYFPIFSGRHRNEWSSCSQCHTNPGNFSVFSCLECHIRSETDDKHDGVPAYEYNSNACYECHPTGSE